MKVLQVNLNRSRTAQDLLYHTRIKYDAKVLLVTEPNKSHVVDNHSWIVDNSEDVAIRAYDRIPTKIGTGDLNAKIYLWGSKIENARGLILKDWLAAHDLLVINLGAATFSRGEQESVIDVTFASTRLADRIRDWRVLDDESLNDHQVIYFDIELGPTTGARSNVPSASTRRWRYKPDKAEELAAKIGEELGRAPSHTAISLVGAVQEACRKTLPNVRPNGKKPVYWWIDEIKELRRTCLAKKRKWTRAKARHQVTEDLRTLFPTRTLTTWEDEEVEADIPPVTADEVAKAAARLKDNKAPGPDGIPPDIIKLVAKKHTEPLVVVYDNIVSAGEAGRRNDNRCTWLTDAGQGRIEVPGSSGGQKPELEQACRNCRKENGHGSDGFGKADAENQWPKDQHQEDAELSSQLDNAVRGPSLVRHAKVREEQRETNEDSEERTPKGKLRLQNGVSGSGAGYCLHTTDRPAGTRKIIQPRSGASIKGAKQEMAHGALAREMG
ncbi:hypothetical protein NQ314_013779 [Rhamnusium bicolor]|uniref:Endonuclease/exonuclease/phosphatase domain-containing protein n=1 Tax=Rhamnusium bicolor TaxID=1586634 RepID=A0AAV8X775_9CUCU|nr:hypothetical protein NQ314_013779 [Rhamnusium bicolor]